MTAADILIVAAKRLESHGWLQGGYCGVEQSMVHTNVVDIKETDVVGAIRCAAGGHFENKNDEAAAEAKEALREYVGGGSLGSWNDADERTKDEVIEALKETAKICMTKRFKPVHVFPWPVLRFA